MLRNMQEIYLKHVVRDISGGPLEDSADSLPSQMLVPVDCGKTATWDRLGLFSWIFQCTHRIFWFGGHLSSHGQHIPAPSSHQARSPTFFQTAVPGQSSPTQVRPEVPKDWMKKPPQCMSDYVMP